MKIFVLEDGIRRTKAFKNACIGHHLDLVDNVEEAQILLMQNEYDLIFLDHDLDDKSFVDPDEPNTGTQLAKFLRKNSRNNVYINDNLINAKIIIHTHNPNGVDHMKWYLPDAICIPFINLDLGRFIK